MSEEFFDEWLSIEKVARKYQRLLQEEDIEPSKLILEEGKTDAE